MLSPCLGHLLACVAQGVLGVWEVEGMVSDGRVEHFLHEVRLALCGQEAPPGELG